MLLLGLLLAGCGETEAPREGQLSGINNPESVVVSFFEDLGDALKDPSLGSAERRGYWVDRLAGYFAPNERDDQRLALREALGSFAGDLEQLEADETLTLELRGFERVRKVSEEGERATVQLPEATLYMLITRATESGPVTIYEQPIALSRLIGSAQNTVPLVRVGGRWYLTEG